MGQKNNIAIIGALTSVGRSLAKSLSIKNRLLLVDKHETELINLKAGLQITNINTEVELFDCSKEACWEADIIILSANSCDQPLFASIFKEVAACKTVICIASTDTIYKELKSILPNSKVVNVTEGDNREVDDIINEIMKYTD
ncbi:MAG: hypothetical protein NVSMB45_07910 [Ginsengibacter sp.]